MMMTIAIMTIAMMTTINDNYDWVDDNDDNATMMTTTMT